VILRVANLEGHLIGRDMCAIEQLTGTAGSASRW
jgi:hypothetical protein